MLSTHYPPLDGPARSRRRRQVSCGPLSPGTPGSGAAAVILARLQPPLQSLEGIADGDVVTLRSAAPPDAGGVACVHVRSWQAAYRGLLPADFLTGLQPADWAAGYTFDAQDPVTTVAVDFRSGIVGFATVSITPPLARLMAFYVDPDLWGRGIGSQLLKQAMDSFRTAGCTVAELWVMDGNERAQHFYRSHGWHPVVGHKRENVRGIEVDEVSFQAAL